MVPVVNNDRNTLTSKYQKSVIFFKSFYCLYGVRGDPANSHPVVRP